MILNVLTPTRKLVENLEIEEVVVPAAYGEADILEGHAPLMSTLETGVVRYREKGSSEFKQIIISWGYLEVNPKSVNILSETAEEPDKIDLSRVTEAITTSEKMLANADISVEDMQKYQRKLKRAQARKTAVEGNKTLH